VSSVVPDSIGIDWARWIGEIGVGILGYALVLFGNPTQPFFRDGLRVLKRYPRIWLWLAGMSFAYWLFQLTQAWELGELKFSVYDLVYWPAPMDWNWRLAASRAWLPALELLAGLFNQIVVSFPLSGIAALLFLLNWGDSHFALIQEMRARLGRWCIPAYGGLVICAFGALLKPVFGLSIRWLNQFLDGIFLLRLGAVLDSLSFAFEYLFGLVIQVYLVLLAFVWIRGIHSTPERIFIFALKRMAHLAKWAGLILLIGALAIHLPLLASYLWIGQFTDFTSAAVEYVDQTARPLLAIALILFCSMQVSLVLHNESFRQAVSEHTAFMRQHWYRVLWFIIIAGMHLFLACWAGAVWLDSYKGGSVPYLLGLFLLSTIKAILAAWFLAAWVCLYRNARRPRKEIRF
jgi:hypothetical protein